SRGCRFGRLYRPVRAARPRVGFPSAARAVDQRFGAQVRFGLSGSGMGALARPGCAPTGAGVRRQLPRRIYAHLCLELFSARLREQGWLVTASTFPENRQDLAVLRVVVRAGMSRDMADLFLDGVRKQTGSLQALKAPLPQRSEEEVSAFKH